MFSQDFILNGEGHGPVANLLAGVRCDPGLLRPYFDEHNRVCYTVNTGRKKLVERRAKDGRLLGRTYQPIYEEVLAKDLRDAGVQLPPTANATSLRKEEWLQLDSQTIPPQRERLRLYGDVARMNTFSFDGMSKMILEHETVSDPGTAYTDMNGLSEGTTDTPLFQLEGQPIPITHASFKYDLRTLMTSRNSGMPLNTRGVEWATRRVVERVEQNAIGVAGTALEYGGNSTQVGGYGRTSALYGLLNFPDRITKTDLNTPTGANPEATVQDVLEMRQLLYDAKHYGPYMLYHSTDWDQFLDNDYARLGGDNASMTLRQRLLNIGVEDGDVNTRQIRGVKRLDYLTPTNSNPFTMVMVSMNPNVIRAINGMPVTVFQYETKGGWELHFRVACIMLTEHFVDYNGNCGILEARAA